MNCCCDRIGNPPCPPTPPIEEAITRYTVLTQQVNGGSTDEIVAMQLTVPANTWNDGETVVVDYVAEVDNTDDSTVFVPKIYAGAESFDPTFSGTGDGLTLGNPTYKRPYSIRYRRVGTEIYIQDGEGISWRAAVGTNEAVQNMRALGIQGAAADSTPFVFPIDQGFSFYTPEFIASSPNFAANIILKLTITPQDGGSALDTFTPSSAMAWKINKA